MESSFEEHGTSITDIAERHLFAEALLGHEVQVWLKSSVGRYITGKAKIELAEFIDWALGPDATPEEFAKRREKALAAQTLMAWTIEQVQAGLSAETQIDEANRS